MKPIPTFESEDEEREFWATHDSTEYVDWDKASPANMPNLRRSSGDRLEPGTWRAVAYMFWQLADEIQHLVLRGNDDGWFAALRCNFCQWAHRYD